MKAVVLFLTFLISRLAAFGAVQALPLGYDDFEGETSSGAPFDGAFPYRYQQVIDAGDFLILGHSPGWIQELNFRIDSPAGENVDATPFFQMNLSTTQHGVNDLSLVFAENIGPDEMTVFGPGAVVWFAGHNRFDQPQSFDLHVVLDQPFLYDPTEGNLLMDIWGYTQSPPQYVSPLDATDLATDGVARVVAVGTDSTVATISDTKGLIIQVRLTPVPEPQVWWLALVFMPGWVIRKRFLKREST